jgi:hypothetical protein
MRLDYAAVVDCSGMTDWTGAAGRPSMFCKVDSIMNQTAADMNQ